MKALLTVALVLGFVAPALAEKPEIYKINLDWNNRETLDDSVTMMCDDTNYAYVELTIPGEESEDFDVTIEEASFRDGKFYSGCIIEKKKGPRGSTRYMIQPDDYYCSISIHNRNGSGKKKKASYRISDAC
ncbi:MAG: hypothetical protein AB7O96_04760 [Pseudobdellovibrionaceae bacterium]